MRVTYEDARAMEEALDVADGVDGRVEGEGEADWAVSEEEGEGKEEMEGSEREVRGRRMEEGKEREDIEVSAG